MIIKHLMVPMYSNYAPMVDGLPEAKDLFSKMLGVSHKRNYCWWKFKSKHYV